MRFLTWLVGFVVLVFLILGFGFLAHPQPSDFRVDIGTTLLVVALMLMIIAALWHHRTDGGHEPIKTPSRAEMYALFNAALLCLVIGGILEHQIEFARSGANTPWAVAVGVPVYDSLFGYVILIIPANYTVFFLLRSYEPKAKLENIRHNPRNKRLLDKLRLGAFGGLLLVATLGLAASLIEIDFMYVPSMILTWLFCFMLFAGIASVPKPKRDRPKPRFLF